MVNLVVVALILTSSLAYDIVINNFQFVCQKQNGEFVGLGSYDSGETRVDIYVSRISGTIFSKAKTLVTFPINVGARPPGTVVVPTQRTEDGRKVTVILTLGCSLPYRSLCPAVNNICVSTGKEHPTVEMDYTGQEAKFTGGVYLLRTPQDTRVVASKAELPKNKMTNDEYCKVPKDQNSISCNFRDSEQYSHTSQDVQSNESNDSSSVEAKPVQQPESEGEASAPGGNSGTTKVSASGDSTTAAATTAAGAFMMALPLLALF